MCEVLDRIENRGIQQGIRQGIQQGKQQAEENFAHLMRTLFAAGRVDDAKRASEDEGYRRELMKELGIAD